MYRGQLKVYFRLSEESRDQTWKLPTKSACKFYILYLTQNKMNLFVLSGHGSESFAAFLNGVILQKKQRGSYHCSCHHNTSRE